MSVNRDGRYHTVFEDQQNSTSTPLGAGEEWFGKAAKNNHSHVQVAARSDTTGVVKMWFSTDEGENWDSVVSYELEAGQSFFKILVKGVRTYRTSFTNHGGLQADFRLQTDFGTLTAPMSPDSGGMLVELAGPLSPTAEGGEALRVTDLETEAVHDSLKDIIDELRVMNMHMAQMTGASWTKEDL